MVPKRSLDALEAHDSPGASSSYDDRSAFNSPAAAAYDSDDEEAWDEVDVTLDQRASKLAANKATAAGGDGEGIEIVISKAGAKPKGKGAAKKKSDGSTTRERMIRQEKHKTHTICLLATGLIRNRYINNKELQARLLSKVPLHLQNAFIAFNRTSHPNERDRSRLFDHALKDLVSWWYQSFTIDEDTGIKRMSVAEVDAQRKASGSDWTSKQDDMSKKGKGKAREQEPRGGEEVHSVKSLMKRAILLRGSRDMSAQLFTCLCRALDLPARLVFSLQPVDWRAPSAATKSSGKRKGDGEAGKGKGKKAEQSGVEEEDSGSESWEDGQGKLAYKVPAVRLRKTKTARRDMNRSPSPEGEDMNRFPVLWTEVWTRSNRHWIPVDPTRKKMRCRGIMEPPRSYAENQMLYVVAFEEDGTARDITPRYAKSYNTVTVKARGPSKKGTDWFADLLLPYQRAFQLNRDREEEEELWNRRANAPMPTSVAGFKNHPSYVLEQHLHRDETIRPNTKPVGTFRGTEVVYLRSAVVALKSTENYWREGRVVKDGEEAMKWVKQRNVTINRKRVEEAALLEGADPMEQGLYAAYQTEMYVPPPVVNGKIPRNDFGNIDLYVPSMLPFGAVHLPHKGAAKCAKTLGIEYAEAVTGFEFRQRRALPILSGVVVAADMADVLLEAIINTAEIADEKEFAKRQDRCLKRWKKLTIGLRIRQRLQASYQDNGPASAPSEQASQFQVDEDQVPPPAKASSSRSKPTANPPPLVSATRVAPTLQPKSLPKAKPDTRATTADPPASPSTPNRSTSGRTLRFTMPAEKAASTPAPRAGPSTRGGGKLAPLNATDDSEGSDNSESSLELLSDF